MARVGGALAEGEARTDAFAVGRADATVLLLARRHTSPEHVLLKVIGK